MPDSPSLSHISSPWTLRWIVGWGFCGLAMGILIAGLWGFSLNFKANGSAPGAYANYLYVTLPFFVLSIYGSQMLGISKVLGRYWCLNTAIFFFSALFIAVDEARFANFWKLFLLCYCPFLAGCSIAGSGMLWRCQSPEWKWWLFGFLPFGIVMVFGIGLDRGSTTLPTLILLLYASFHLLGDLKRWEANSIDLAVGLGLFACSVLFISLHYKTAPIYEMNQKIHTMQIRALMSMEGLDPMIIQNLREKNLNQGETLFSLALASILSFLTFLGLAFLFRRRLKKIWDKEGG